MKGESSETIPNGSREEILEMVATLVNFYVLIDPNDGLIKYVGRTVDIENRLRNHLYEARKHNRNKRERWITSLLRKNQKPHMKVIYTKMCLLDEAIEIERMLIRKLGKRYILKNGNDHALGGSISTNMVFQYSLTGEFVKSYLNSHIANVETGIKDCNISRCCKNQNGYGTKTAGGFFWSFVQYKQYPNIFIKEFEKIRGKPVIAVDKDGVEHTFPSARKAYQEFGVNYKKISAACNNKIQSAGGYTWKFQS